MRTRTSLVMLLPAPPRHSGTRAWDDLRRELRQYHLKMTVLGMDARCRPRVRIEGERDRLRAWLDQAGYQGVKI